MTNPIIRVAPINTEIVDNISFIYSRNKTLLFRIKENGITYETNNKINRNRIIEKYYRVNYLKRLDNPQFNKSLMSHKDYNIFILSSKVSKELRLTIYNLILSKDLSNMIIAKDLLLGWYHNEYLPKIVVDG